MDGTEEEAVGGPELFSLAEADGLLTTDATAQALRISAATLRRWIRAGSFRPPVTVRVEQRVQVTRRAAVQRHRASDVAAKLAEREGSGPRRRAA